MTIIERICALLSERGMKKKTVIDAIDISPSTFSTWIGANVEGIPSQYIPGIAKVFGMTCDELLTGETSIVTDKNEQHLIGLFRDLDWDGQQMVLAAIVTEKRRLEAATAQETDAAMVPIRT